MDPPLRGPVPVLCSSALIEPREIEVLIRRALPDAQVRVKSLRETQDHFEVEVVSAAFAGKGLVDRHRMIYAALAEELKGPIHALSLRTRAPAEETP